MQSIILLTLSLTVALAWPAREQHQPRRTLQKRADPDTAGDIVEPEVDAVEQGFKDAIELVNYVLTGTDERVQPIFAKYFDTADEATVVSAFNQIAGNPADPTMPDPTGNNMLGQILVQRDDVEGQCTGLTIAYMGDHNTDDPFITVCDPLFQHKAIQDTTCDELGDNVSYKMLTIGGTFLHEYTHWDALVQNIVGGEIIDQPNGYGPVNARNLDKALALKNADNYAYFASEVFWSTICQKDYADPRAGIDDDDPACDGVCTS